MLQRLIFIGVVLLIYVGIFFYFKNRFLAPFRLEGRNKRLSEIFLLIFIVAPIFSFLLFFAGGPGREAVAWLAFSIFGVVFTLLPYSVTRDILQFAGRIIQVIRKKASGNRNLPAPSEVLDSRENAANEISRRDFLLRSNYAIFSLAAFSDVYGFTEVMREPRVFRHNVYLETLPEEFDGFTIAQISDVHIGPMLRKKFLDKVVDRINSLEPSMVAITGDLVDGSVDELKDDMSPLARLNSRSGTYFVTGNHEYYSGAEQWTEYLEKLGIHVLNNSHHAISGPSGKKNVSGKTRTEKGRLIIAGIPDRREGPVNGHPSDPVTASANTLPGDTRILLAHQPLGLDRAIEAGFHLQLSGHTHGGQFFPWNLAVSVIYPCSAGLYHYKNKMWVNVNRGTGYWGPPLRLGVPSEITLITLKRKPAFA